MANLEDVGKVPQVEDVVEFDGGGQERSGDLRMEVQRSVDDLLHVPLNLLGEPSAGHVTLQDALVDGAEGLGAGEAHGKDAEMSLQPWVDGEAACSWVHAGHVLYVMDLLQHQLYAVIPVVVVEVLRGSIEEEDKRAVSGKFSWGAKFCGPFHAKLSCYTVVGTYRSLY